MKAKVWACGRALPSCLMNRTNSAFLDHGTARASRLLPVNYRSQWKTWLGEIHLRGFDCGDMNEAWMQQKKLLLYT
ncbi:hypothetical protein PoB_006429900 [Plakobranchus ocellatus]|uniref:Uncharacterized protein n=1 Tax=Plakobranchus ocellatus TaxID=259542 RepID=A0AAV4D0R4_9GAST|nr:hypothetical protein PoB_006429900 [Plakobranchus ocellatus]